MCLDVCIYIHKFATECVRVACTDGYNLDFDSLYLSDVSLAASYCAREWVGAQGEREGQGWHTGRRRHRSQEVHAGA